MPDQTASQISGELVKLFTTYSLPGILHSDQGWNFESTILIQVLSAFGVKMLRTMMCTHKEMVWLNISTGLCYSS